MYRFVFSWRWVRLHVLVWLVLIPAFLGLGMWQRGRYHERTAENAVIKAAMHAAPVPLDGLDPVGGVVPRSDRWKQVTVTGSYDTRHQYLARNHQQNGSPGFWVITPLVSADGTAVLVNRGWIAGDGADARATPAVPAPPAGTVALVGRLQLSETKATTGLKDVTEGLPAGQITLVNTESLAQLSGLRLRGGYVERISSTPADTADVAKLDEPSLDEGPYLAYWFQWWLFAAIAVGAWVVIIRREAQHRREEAEEAELDDELEDGLDGELGDGVEAEAGGQFEAEAGGGSEVGTGDEPSPVGAAGDTPAESASPTRA